MLAVLYVSIMGLCYKTKDFFTFICQYRCTC